jgi:hypothetical protein
VIGQKKRQQQDDKQTTRRQTKLRDDKQNAGRQTKKATASAGRLLALGKEDRPTGPYIEALVNPS